MTTLKLFASTALVMVLAACGNQKTAQSLHSSSTGIVNGSDVTADDAVAKSTVALLVSLEGYPEAMFCTGTLVSENVIITAAHCLEDYRDIGYDQETGEFKEIRLKVTGGNVAFATNAKTGNPTKRSFTRFSIHPQYQPKEVGQGSWNDIAILQFEGSLPDGYQPVPVLQDKAQLKTGLTVTFAGFGITSPLGNDAKVDDSGVLRKGDSVLSRADFEGNELLFQLPTSGVSTCQGDSGGPAFAKIAGQLTLVGVTSRGEDSFCRGVSISTSVAAHVDFIRRTMGSMKSVEVGASKTDQAQAE